MPATIAGAILSAISSSGTFHGMMAPTTPIGSRWVMVIDAGLERHGLALQLRAEPAIEHQHVGEDAGLDPAFGADRLAGLERDEPRQLLDMVVEDAAAFMDQPPALARGELGPALLRLGRRG